MGLAIFFILATLIHISRIVKIFFLTFYDTGITVHFVREASMTFEQLDQWMGTGDRRQIALSELCDEEGFEPTEEQRHKLDEILFIHGERFTRDCIVELQEGA
jgi:hypothetical protein